MIRLAGRLPFIGLTNNRPIFKEACERYDLVYFGSVSKYDDDHEMVRGFTLSPSHVDRHYCVGTVSSRDIILLERQDTISFPSKASRSFTWTVLQIDLAVSNLPHILLNSTRYDEIIYSVLMAKYHHMKVIEGVLFAAHEAAFNGTFKAYTSTQDMDRGMALLSLDTTSVLGHHFSQFDYEMLGDRLLVYHLTKSPSEQSIESMFKAGIWLAGQIETTHLG